MNYLKLTLSLTKKIRRGLKKRRVNHRDKKQLKTSLESKEVFKLKTLWVWAMLSQNKVRLKSMKNLKARSLIVKLELIKVRLHQISKS